MSFLSTVLGPVASIASTVLGGLFGASSQNSANEANLQATRETNQMNRDLFNQQLGYNTQMWNATNYYNSPEQQVKRLRDAGLNPYMMLENGQSGSVASQPSTPSPAAAVAPHQLQPLMTADTGVSIMNSVMDNAAKAIDLQTRAKENLSRINSMEAKGQLDRDTADKIRQDTFQSFSMFPKLMENMDLQLEMANEEIADIRFNRSIRQVQADLMRSQIRINEEQAKYIVQDAAQLANRTLAQLMSGRAALANAAVLRRSVDNEMKRFYSDPRNGWFRSLPKEQRDAIYGSLKGRFYSELSADVSAMKLKYEQNNWFNRPYFRILSSIERTLNTVAPVRGSMSQGAELGFDLMTK